MDWIFEHFQIVILIALALASVVKRRIDMKTAEREGRQAGGEEAGDGEVFGPGEGWPQPPAHAPLVRQSPPPITRPPLPPTLPLDPYQDSAMLKRQQELQQRLRKIRATKTTTTGGAAATRSRVSAAQRHPSAEQAAAQAGGLRASLHHRPETRRAILMREILGPPVGLR